MALVQQGFWLVIQTVDNGGDITTKTFQMKATTQVAAETDAPVIIAAYNAMTSGVIVSHYFYEKFVEDTLIFPLSGVENPNQALLNFQLADDPTKTATVSIPAADPAIFQGTTGPAANIVDTADAAVIAFRNLFLDAGPLYLSDGESAESLLGGRRIHRKTRIG